MIALSTGYFLQTRSHWIWLNWLTKDACYSWISSAGVLDSEIRLYQRATVNNTRPNRLPPHPPVWLSKNALVMIHHRCSEVIKQILISHTHFMTKKRIHQNLCSKKCFFSQVLLSTKNQSICINLLKSIGDTLLLFSDPSLCLMTAQLPCRRSRRPTGCPAGSPAPTWVFLRCA